MSTPPPPPGGRDDNPYDYDPNAQGDSRSQGSSNDGSGNNSGSGGYQAAPNYSGGQTPNDVDNNFGVIALITGIVGLVICQPLGIVAIIYGRKAQAAQAADRANNATLGTVGFWLGVVALILLVISIIFLVVVCRRRCQRGWVRGHLTAPHADSRAA